MFVRAVGLEACKIILNVKNKIVVQIIKMPNLTYSILSRGCIENVHWKDGRVNVFKQKSV